MFGLSISRVENRLDIDRGLVCFKGFVWGRRCIYGLCRLNIDLLLGSLGFFILGSLLLDPFWLVTTCICTRGEICHQWCGSCWMLSFCHRGCTALAALTGLSTCFCRLRAFLRFGIFILPSLCAILAHYTCRILCLVTDRLCVAGCVAVLKLSFFTASRLHISTSWLLLAYGVYAKSNYFC